VSVEHRSQQQQRKPARPTQEEDDAELLEAGGTIFSTDRLADSGALKK
jgi:hypothetical protein